MARYIKRLNGQVVGFCEGNPPRVELTNQPEEGWEEVLTPQQQNALDLFFQVLQASDENERQESSNRRNRVAILIDEFGGTDVQFRRFFRRLRILLEAIGGTDTQYQLFCQKLKRVIDEAP